MGNIDLNFGGVDGASNFDLPEGEYILVCNEVEVKEGKAAPYLNMKFSVADGEHEGKWVFHIASLGEKSRGFLQEMLEALTGVSWRNDNMSLDPNDLPGLTAKANVYQEAYTDNQGRPKMASKVKSWIPKNSVPNVSVPEMAEPFQLIQGEQGFIRMGWIKPTPPNQPFQRRDTVTLENQNVNSVQQISDFLNFIYGENEGYAYVATKHPSFQQQFKQEFFHWPAEADKIAQYVLKETITNEVYYAPALFKERFAQKEHFKSATCYWVEFDGNAPTELGEIPAPTLRIKSSQEGHEHWYWKSDTNLDIHTLETVNRALTYALGADVSGWDAGQILRPPCTTNHKRQLPVGIISKSEQIYNKADFGALPEPPALLEVVLPDHLPAVEDVIATTTFSDSLWTLFKDGVVEGKRSSGLMALGYGLAELGAEADAILALLLNADMRWGKFANRSDQLIRLIEIVTRAKEKHPNPISDYDDSNAVDFTRFGFLDLLNSSIEIEWVWENFLQTEGYLLVTGPPGTGKTQFSLNLAQNFCLGKDFLGEKIDTERNVAFFSLEMGPADLKLFIQHQAGGYSPEELSILQQRLSLYPLGEPLYLSDTKERDRVEKLIVELGLDGLVIDSLGSLTEDELTNEKQIKNLMAWIDYVRRKYGVFIIIIHHHRKASGENKTPNKLGDVYGSFFITRNATTVLCLWDNKGKLSVIPLKVRLAAKPLPFAVFRNENLLFTKGEITLAEQQELTADPDMNPGFTEDIVGPTGMTGI